MREPYPTSWRLVQEIAAGFFVLLVWEVSTTPHMHPSPSSWQGVWGSIAFLPFCAYLLSRSRLRASWFFVYGLAASLVFLPRVLGAGEFRWWIEHRAPNDYVVIMWWLGVAMGLGALCWGAAQLQRAGSARRGYVEALPLVSAQEPAGSPRAAETLALPKSHERLGLSHLFLWTLLVGGYLGLVRAFAAARPFFASPTKWPYSFVTIAVAIGAGAALIGVVLFVARRARGIDFPIHPGEYLLLAWGVRSVFSLVAQGAIVLTSSPETAFPSVDESRALNAAGSLIMALVLMAPFRGSKWHWRIFFACMAAICVLNCFETNFSRTSFERWYRFLRYAPSVALLGVVASDLSRRRRFPWTHWLGVATQLWISASGLLWLVLPRA